MKIEWAAGMIENRLRHYSHPVIPPSRLMPTFCTLLPFRSRLICQFLRRHRFLVTACRFLYPWSGLNPPLSLHPHRGLNFQAIAKKFRELRREMMRESDAFSGNLWANKGSQPGDGPCLPLLFYPPQHFLLFIITVTTQKQNQLSKFDFDLGGRGGDGGNIRNPRLCLIYFHNKM